MTARYVVGIDLGTSNSALAYIDTAELPRRLVCFPVPQLVGPGDVAALPTLPSGEYDLDIRMGETVVRVECLELR